MKEKKDNTDSFDFEYNLILLGDSSVGKTCFFKKLTSGIFKEINVSTIGIDRRTFDLKCDLEEQEGKVTSKIVKVNITDTAGQERYKALTKSYYKNSDAALILYDITEEKTYDNIDSWIDSINESINTDKEKYTMFLLGTKIDLVTSGKKEREVNKEDAESKCKENKLEWGGEISNKECTEEQFKEMVAGFIKIIYKKNGDKKEKQNSLDIAKFKKKEKRRQGCC